uniref:Uncharacterized protein n=1 Tax=Ditylenchus dipsaci TaxID=166011 RepID=A0A915E2J7_9BILA
MNKEHTYELLMVILMESENLITLQSKLLTNENAAKQIIDQKQGLQLMGRDYIYMYKSLNAKILNLNDRKRNIILLIHFPEGFICVQPYINNYIFSRAPISYNCIERKCTVQEFIDNGCNFL